MNSTSLPQEIFIDLVFYISQDNQEVFLHIPLSKITSITPKPHKYLRYLGWCIRGEIGTLRTAPDLNHGVDVFLEAEDMMYSRYYYVPEGGMGFRRSMVDIEVVRNSRNILKSSNGTNRSPSFRSSILQRDKCCVFGGFASNEGCHAMHIIPLKRGERWFRQIIDLRNAHTDPSTSSNPLTDINDIRNGLLVHSPIHAFFRSRNIGIIKTPNEFLDASDIHPSSNHPNLDTDSSHSPRSRYTLHWLTTPSPPTAAAYPNCRDATFPTSTLDPSTLPSDILLPYIYGASAVYKWGKNIDILTTQEKFPRPEQLSAKAFDRIRHRTERGSSSHPGPSERDDDSESESDSESSYVSDTNLNEADIAMAAVGLFWSRSSEVQAAYQEERDAERTKISDWLKDVPPSET
ncbi:hypothetical protein SISSUDRAFT_1036518 [Sistotremastrum suecicum HHB10207 ss-3]|uniref:HNH nuclease domain-containing protein n=1 Tax=Sistotremastrum suecicum HHB10207 ss-3 TaxID=1314776 RepID=A0A165ZBK4_9AGAM|nr:hypothetical protein SISSUDRAFT_1036518 [Sistotremastrum suecicum HHB10207 ss-3]